MKITYLDLHKGIIKPIHKGGSMYNLDNNRGITLTSNVYKVYAKIIEQSVMNFMEDRHSFGISLIPQAFPDLRLSRTDLMFS
jgi:hypothetical protein